MKKTIIIMMALAFAFTGTVYAANTVQVTLTSPSILKVGCEKAGAVTYSFDGNTVLSQGDWWYFDLPNNVTLCKSIDYFISFGSTPGATTDFIDGVTVSNEIAAADGVNLLNGQTADLNGVLTPFPGMAMDSILGPFSYNNVGGGAVALPAANIFFRVKGDAGQRRVWVYVYGLDTSVPGTVGPPAVASVPDTIDTLTIPADKTLKIKILDGENHTAHILLDTDADGTFGEVDVDTIDFGGTRVVPYVENTLCINAENYTTGNEIFVSFDSILDKFTFTGDSQIAHVNQNPITLAVCKTTSVNNIPLASGQTGVCRFDYETPTGYCTGKGLERILIQSSSPFGVPTDRYDIRVVSETQGVYFSGAPSVGGFLPSADECTDTATAVTSAWTAKNEAGTLNPGYPGTNCSVPSANRVRDVYTSGGNIVGIQDYDVLYVNLPAMVYDTSFNLTGSEARVTVYLDKYPCGNIFSQTIVLGTFVSTCPTTTTAGTTNLLYPWFPPLDPTVIPGWWGGFTVVNAGTTSGTVTLTFWEADGDSGTLTTPTIVPGGQWNAGMFVDLLTQITPAAANTGTLGDANFAVTAVCNFAGAGGFAFTGNGDEGTGYTAYVGTGGAWQ